MKWWKDYPWRMIQTNLREIDFQDMDPMRMVEDLKSFHATVALINAGGISASYPTSLPWQYQNPWAKHDGLKRLVELCHENHIRVIARTDFSKVRQELYEEHPEWAFRTADQKVINYNGYVQTCPSSIYQQEYAFHILREIFETIPFDGLFCNMGGFQTQDYSFVDYGFCHCESCRSRFREMSGYEHLPLRENTNDPVYMAYTMFQKQAVREYRRKMVEFLKTFDRELCFDDEDYARIEASTELHRRLPHWQYHASSNCRAILGDGSSNIVCSNTSVDYVGYALRDVAVNPAQQKLREWQNMTNLGGLDYYLMGRIDNHLDRSGFDGIRKIFAFHAEHAEEFLGMKNLGRVLLRRQDRWVATEEEKGWIRTLTEAHIPFAEILPTEYATADLSKFDLVILADSQYLSEKEVAVTDAFVRRGGTILAVGGTGLVDEKKGRRTVPSLRSQGIRSIRRECSDMASAMFLIPQEARQWFGSNPDSDVVALGDRYLFLETEADTVGLLPMVPVHPFGPPECCYATEVSDEKAVYIHSYGRGKAVTVPWYPGEFYARTGFDNLRLFMQDVLVNLCNAAPIAGNLTPMVELSLSGRGEERLVQMVNNSGSFGLSFFDPLPVENIFIKIPLNFSPGSVYALRDGKIRWRHQEGCLQLWLDQLEDYEAILIKP